MNHPPAKKNRTNLIAGIAIAVVLVVGGVVAIVVATSGGGGGGRRGTPAPEGMPSPAETRRAEERDAALRDGRVAVETFNTLDHRNVEDDLDRWESVATGELLDEVREKRQQYVSRITAAKSTSVATVLDVALTDLDERAGTARLIAAVSIDVTVEGQEPAHKRTRLTADLERTGDGWKVSRIGTR